LNRFYIERSSPLPSAFAGYAPLPSLALLLAFGPPLHNTQYLGIGLFLLRSALWEQLSGSYLAFSASPTLPVAAGCRLGAGCACRDSLLCAYTPKY
jgi:hypothetical protein